MKTFKIEIQEFLSKIIEVKAKSEDEALTMVKEMYNNEDIVLTNEDFVSTEISPYSE